MKNYTHCAVIYFSLFKHLIKHHTAFFLFILNENFLEIHWYVTDNFAVGLLEDADQRNCEVSKPFWLRCIAAYNYLFKFDLNNN